MASYSGFYRFPPWGRARAARHLRPSAVDFGYDEVNHRFHLPPPSGHPELIFFASRSAADTPPRLGPLTVVTNTTLADISSQYAQRDLTFNNDLGTKFTLPLREFAGIRSSVSAGLDYKSYRIESFSTNLTYFDLYALDQYGNPVLVTNQTVALPANSQHSVFYLPLSLGWFGSRPDAHGSTSLSLNENVFLAPLASARTNFQSIAGASGAGGTYTTLNAGVAREQKLFGDWSALFRANGQWSSAPLISNEQFALGGTAGVRGYREGETYGDTGWRTQLDFRAPAVHVGYFPYGSEVMSAYLRCSWFMDYGEAYHLAPSSGLTVQEWGTGLGFFLTVGEYVEARLTVGWALHDAPTTRPGDAQAYFSIGFQF